jgi:hypothetical protein
MLLSRVQPGAPDLSLNIHPLPNVTVSQHRLKPPKDPIPQANMATPHTNLGSLSNELIINIIRYISSADEVEVTGLSGTYSQRHLFHFSLCSKRLYSLTEPILYHRFVEGSQANPTALQLFLRRIIVRPDLANRVQVYHGTGKDKSYPDELLDITYLKEEPIWTEIQKRVGQISENAEEAKEWIKSIGEGDWDAITALTLSLTRNIQDLIFRGWNYKDEVYPILLQYLSRARTAQSDGRLDNPFSLRHLRKVTLEYCDTEGGMGVDLLFPFLFIPSVHTFWATMVNEESDHQWNGTIPKFPHIKELSLKPANMTTDALQQFLQSFPNLERLYYCSGYEWPTLEPPRFLAAINHLKPVLQELCLFNQNYIGVDIEDFPIGSLTGFTKLKTLRMDPIMLTGKAGPATVIDGFRSRQDLVTSLPASLCHLELRNYQGNESLESEIKNLISCKPTTFPHLKSLDINWERIQYPDKPSPPEPHIFPGFEREDALRLLQDMEEVGVEMVMPSKPPQPQYINYIQAGTHVCISVDYPYTDYEKLCREHGCDPVTGKGPGMFY